MSADLVMFLLPLLVLVTGGVVFAVGWFSPQPSPEPKQAKPRRRERIVRDAQGRPLTQPEPEVARGA